MGGRLGWACHNHAKLYSVGVGRWTGQFNHALSRSEPANAFAYLSLISTDIFLAMTASEFICFVDELGDAILYLFISFHGRSWH